MPTDTPPQTVLLLVSCIAAKAQHQGIAVDQDVQASSEQRTKAESSAKDTSDGISQWQQEGNKNGNQGTKRELSSRS